MPEFQRPVGGFDFTFGGVNLCSPADALTPTEYACAQNIRAISDKKIQTRPGYVRIDSGAASGPITDIRAYSTLGTDNFPRFLCRDSNNHIVSDSGATACILAGSVGSGACMIPFRPNQSPQSWMYVCGLGDYQKISAPVGGSIVAQKVGIAEPQEACDFAPQAAAFTDFSGLATNWAEGGTAGALSDETRSTDTTTAIFQDPVISTRYSVQTGTPATVYQVSAELIFARAPSGSYTVIAQDVIPAVSANLVINAIRYASGTSGHCYIVPSQSPFPETDQLATLRRGALIKLKNSEVVLVLSCVIGTDGSACIETSTSGTFAAGDSIAGVPALIVDGIDATVVGQALTTKCISSTLSAGIGTISRTLSSSPFKTQLGSSGLFPQKDDYIHLSLYIDEPTFVTDIKIVFAVNAGVDYEGDLYYYSLAPSVLAPVVTTDQTQTQAIQKQAIQDLIDQTLEIVNEPTQLGYSPEQRAAIAEAQRLLSLQQQQVIAAAAEAMKAGSKQYTEVMFPISDLTSVVSDETKTLINCTGVQVSINNTGGVVAKIGSLWVGGGGQPDVGDQGAEYRYRLVPRSAVTGAIGNPTPSPRYGTAPRRQTVTVKLLSSSYDPQIDTWDVYRYGGTIPSWQYAGSAPSSAGYFYDNYFDDSLKAAKSMELDNFEPWPSIDLPFTVPATGGNTITVIGTQLVISGPTTWPALIAQWMPGTLIQIGGKGAFTLRLRPVALSASSYLFELEECAGAYSPDSITIAEPKVARAAVPYMWGPNEYGDIFAVGDPLRPGNYYFCKSNNPDSAPDANNDELCPPSEPLIGGEVVGGISLVSSTNRWWALYPSFSYTAQMTGATGKKYTPIEQAVGRPLITPYGHCSDGQAIFFFTKDCIAMTSGGAFKSLTEKIYTLFPHEGVAGQDITRNGVTFYAPDYSRAATFRLCRASHYLYADYEDSQGTHRTLICDLRTGGWSSDAYHDSITVHYGVEQQKGTLTGTTPLLYPAVVMADTNGVLWKQQDNHNDNATPIACVLATFEWDGADKRASQNWNDVILNCTPVSGISLAPVSYGAAVVTAIAIGASPTRATSIANVATSAKFMGVLLAWTDNFSTQSVATSVNFWQPLFQPLPIPLNIWKPEGTGFGIEGYKSIYRIVAAYRAPAAVTMTITTYDGTSPAVITLPSTGNAYRKAIFTLTPNKGMLFFFQALCAQAWQPYFDEWEIHVAPWGRSGPCAILKDFPKLMGAG